MILIIDSIKRIIRGLNVFLFFLSFDCRVVMEYVMGLNCIMVFRVLLFVGNMVLESIYRGINIMFMRV